jgi:hypothetical protein
MNRPHRTTRRVVFAVAACLALAALTLAACGGSDDSGGGSGGSATTAATSPFAGTWKIDGGGISLDPEFAGYSIGIPGEGGTVTVSGDGKAVTMTGSNTVTWTMVAPTVEGEYLTFTAGSDPDADKWAIRQSGGTTTLTKWDDTDQAWDDGYPLVPAQ